MWPRTHFIAFQSNRHQKSTKHTKSFSLQNLFEWIFNPQSFTSLLSFIYTLSLSLLHILCPASPASLSLHFSPTFNLSTPLLSPPPLHLLRLVPQSIWCDSGLVLVVNRGLARMEETKCVKTSKVTHSAG